MRVKVVHNLGMVLVRLSKAVVCLRVLLTWHMWEMGIPLLLMIFDLRHTPPTLTLHHSNPSLSVNELEDPGTIAGSLAGG